MKQPSHALSSGELAERAGVSRDTLRHYERRGLLASFPRLQNGYRRFPPQAVERVRLIRGALAIGFSIEDVSRILRARERGQAPCREVRELAALKAQELESQIAELSALRKELLSTIREWDRKLKSAAPDQPVHLLENFVASHPESTRWISPLVSPGLKRKFQRNEDKRR
jgi:DNA-binding transcriptional MerR regulator